MKKQYLQINTLKKGLQDSDFFDEVFLIEELESSNDYAKKLISENKNFRRAIIVVNKQTKGRGRQNKSWISNFGSCLTFSFVLDSQDFLLWKFSSLVCAKALHKALMDFDEIKKRDNLKIKWPNDIMAGEKKIAGILVENIYRKEILDRQVIGIGLNFSGKNFDSEELKHAGSIESEYEFEVRPDHLFLKIVNSINETFKEKSFDFDYINTYSFLKNKKILCTGGNSKVMGRVLNIDPSGSLTIDTGIEGIKKIISGTIELI